MVTFTGVIALATVVYVIFTIRLWQATNESALATKLNAESLIDSERAWVLGDTIGTLPEFAPDTSKLRILWVYIPLRNFGKTVARITKFSTGQCQISKTNAQALPPDPEYAESGPCDFVLAPNMSFRSTVGISPSDFMGAKRGEIVLYIVGFVEYLILGGNLRKSCFCYVYHIPGGYNPDPEGFYPCTTCPAPYTRCT